MGVFGLSFNVVFPLLVLMALGYFLKTKGLLDKTIIKRMNSLVFKVFLPVNVFMSIYNSDISETFDLHLILYACGSILLIFIILCLVVPLFIKDRADSSTVIQGIFRSNIILYGIFVVEAIYGRGALGNAGVMIAFVIPLFNVLAVLLFKTNTGQEVKFGSLLIGIFSNLHIIASVLAMLLFLLDIRLPAIITGTMDSLGRIAAPLAMVLLGGTFAIGSVKKHLLVLTFSSLARLLVVPGVFLSIAVLLGFKGVDLVVLLVVFGSPTATSSFPMAEEMGGNGALAGEIVMSTSVLSIGTMFLWVTILNVLKLI